MWLSLQSRQGISSITRKNSREPLSECGPARSVQLRLSPRLLLSLRRSRPIFSPSPGTEQSSCLSRVLSYTFLGRAPELLCQPSFLAPCLVSSV